MRAQALFVATMMVWATPACSGGDDMFDPPPAQSDEASQGGSANGGGWTGGASGSKAGSSGEDAGGTAGDSGGQSQAGQAGTANQQGGQGPGGQDGGMVGGSGGAGGEGGQNLGGSGEGAGGVHTGGTGGSAGTSHTGSGNPCSSSSDCPQYEVCSWIDPGSQVARCQQLNLVAVGSVGQACVQDADCRSNLCDPYNLTCTEICAGETHCVAGTLCAKVAVPGTMIRYQCMPGCNANDDCRGGLCVLTYLPGDQSLAQACTGPLGPAAFGEASTNGCASGLAYQGKCTALCVNNTDCAGSMPYCTGRNVDDGTFWGYSVNVCTPHPSGYEACMSYQTSSIGWPTCYQCVSQFDADATLNADTCQYHSCNNSCSTLSCFCDCVTNASSICAQAYSTVVSDMGFLCESECQ